jgi:DNA-directed RNA polymerase subunit RPC12/RpoP
MTLTNATISILALLDDDGKLPTYVWPGGYPVFYVDADMNILCPDCANKNDEYGPKLVATDANYEDSHLFCDHCSRRIESAYAEDEE